MIIVDPDAVAGDCLLATGSDRHGVRASWKAGGADCEEACMAGVLSPEAAHTGCSAQDAKDRISQEVSKTWDTGTNLWGVELAPTLSSIVNFEYA
ncbi:hypothetical protein NDU88_000863 [Pleurodeles waltl]|uniref:Uncharacterized protein n=1 Tax=Pleurodeles waltl TaxID=8319 RepID=A0AAV7USD3_PLEWA|nr:hypothetical protein NDU88_000863 [Pleurodeles waltl]